MLSTDGIHVLDMLYILTLFHDADTLHWPDNTRQRWAVNIMMKMFMSVVVNDVETQLASLKTPPVSGLPGRNAQPST